MTKCQVLPLSHVLFVSTVESVQTHWGEAHAKVAARKNQLEDMLLECRQWDELRAEFEWWLTQVEDEFEGQSQGGDTIDELQKQIQDHKVSTVLKSGNIKLVPF